jgi:hypothetical protein
MTLYQANNEILCRECIIENDPTARFEDDDRWTWNPRFPETWSENMRDLDGDPYGLDPTADFEGEYYPIYRGTIRACEADRLCASEESHPNTQETKQ